MKDSALPFTQRPAMFAIEVSKIQESIVNRALKIAKTKHVKSSKSFLFKSCK
jgi:hypothetical protein